MANFAISITNPTTGDKDISSNSTTITVVDHSNYDTNTELGHTQADFSYFYKVKFTNPDGTTYIFSSIGDGDSVIPTPSVSVLPISILYNYTTGDGVYNVCVMAVPNWNKGVDYVVGQCVSFRNALYICIDNTLAGTPPTDDKFWAVISEDDLAQKYRLCTNFAVTCATNECFIRHIHDAFCSVDGMGCDDNLCNNED